MFEELQLGGKMGKVEKQGVKSKWWHVALYILSIIIFIALVTYMHLSIEAPWGDWAITGLYFAVALILLLEKLLLRPRRVLRNLSKLENKLDRRAE